MVDCDTDLFLIDGIDIEQGDLKVMLKSLNYQILSDTQV
jgi:hypothetical protein